MEMTQVRGDVPLALKRRTFSQLALRGQFFNTWIREQMERWLVEIEAEEASGELVLGPREEGSRCPERVHPCARP